MVEERHARILAHEGGLLLFQAPDAAHLDVGVLGVQAVARAARAVGHHDAEEPLVRLTEAGQDAVQGHDFQVVLMSGNGHVRGARQRGSRRHAIRNVDLRG